MNPSIGNVLHHSMEPLNADRYLPTQQPVFVRPNASGKIASDFGP